MWDNFSKVIILKIFNLAKRLSEKQKEEMVKGFKSGIDIDVLLQKYKCTKSTIIINLKNNLGELKYKELFNENKLLKGKSKSNKKQKNNLLEKDINNEDLKNYPNNPKVLNESFTASNFEPIDSFFEIVPITEFLSGMKWYPQIAIRADQAAGEGAWGAIPVFS